MGERTADKVLRVMAMHNDDVLFKLLRAWGTKSTLDKTAAKLPAMRGDDVMKKLLKLYKSKRYYTPVDPVEPAKPKAAEVTVDLEKGDTIMTGRFKNSPKVVKTIGVDKNGQPTVNGRKMLTFRIEKLMPEEKKAEVEAIPPQELGGILNATLMESIRKQRAQRVAMRNALFDIYSYGTKPVPRNLPYPERVAMIREVLKHLPADRFHLPRLASNPEEQRKLWEDIRTGKNLRTREGVVVWKDGKPRKVKLTADSDVYITGVFPQVTGPLKGKVAGGFAYSLEPGGKTVGRVGTGFNADTKQQMWNSPDQFVGRKARINAQGQFPSGAWRAPSYISLHEDYPSIEESGNA